LRWRGLTPFLRRVEEAGWNYLLFRERSLDIVESWSQAPQFSSTIFTRVFDGNNFFYVYNKVGIVALKKTRICIVGPFGFPGGVARSVFYMALMYRLAGFDVVPVPYPKRVSLRSCDVIHTQGPLFLSFLKMLAENRKAVKIITFHGWVFDERLFNLRYGESNVLKRVVKFVFSVLVWLLNKAIFLRFYHIKTAVSKITARKNGVNALVIPNPYVEKRVTCIDNPYSPDDVGYVKFVTYVSIGGGKILSVFRLIKIVLILNKLLMPLNKKVKLYIFGKDLPSSIRSLIDKYSEYITYMGYRADYLCYLKYADLFLAGYAMPELGHAVVEAIAMGVPVAKFTENAEEEEIVDGVNGILAHSDDEMVKKLYNYVINMKEIKPKLSLSARTTILHNRNIKRVLLKWTALILILMRFHA